MAFWQNLCTDVSTGQILQLTSFIVSKPKIDKTKVLKLYLYLLMKYIQ